MNFTYVALLLAIALFLSMLALIEVGRRIGSAWISRHKDGLPKGTNASEGAIMARLGLIIAFTFSGAASRFEARRHLITEETNNIGTAFLRIELLPEEARPELRELFRRYLDSRLAIYSEVENSSLTNASIAESQMVQDEIWKKAVAACRRPDVVGRPEVLVVPALNAMFDITTTRFAATRNHPPLAIYILMGSLSLISSLLVGYGLSVN